MSTVSTLPSPSLSRLLDVSKCIIETDYKSYRQVVPAFTSLVQAVGVQPLSFPLDDNDDDSDWNLSLWAALTKSDAELASQILHDEQEVQGKKLLVIQFLLSNCPNSPLFGLASLLERFFLGHIDTDENEPMLFDDTFEAALDACLIRRDVSQDEMIAIQRILKICCEAHNLDQLDEWSVREERNWHRTCRILSRLYTCTGQGMEEMVRSVIEALQKAVNTAKHLPLLLKPLANNLLPLVVEQDKNAFYGERIWKALWELPAEEPTALMAVTTVLCILLPSLVSRELPYEDTAKILPLYQDRLWKTIQLCLNQGLRLPQKQSWVKGSYSSRRARGAGQGDETSSSSSLLRRRGLYLLRVLVESDPQQVEWNQYVACFETLEMELESHLIDQVWETVRDLFAFASVDDSGAAASKLPVALSWDWLSLLLGRIIISPDTPVLRKLSLYRLFKGQAGILLTNNGAQPPAVAGDKRKPKKKKKNDPLCGAPITMLTPDFLFDIVLPSFDTLEKSVGLTLHMEGDRVQEDMTKAMLSFVEAYVKNLPPESLRSVLHRLWGPDVLCQWHCRTLVQVFACIASASATSSIPVDSELLDRAASSFEMLFSLATIVKSFQDQLLESWAIILAHTRAEKLAPGSILGVLVFYPIPDTTDDDWINQSLPIRHLRNWLIKGISKDPGWAATAGATIATAFIDGVLPAGKRSSGDSEWDPCQGQDESERAFAASIALFCTLTTTASSNDKNGTANELLWPAIHKGLKHATAATAQASWSYRVTRALLLLESGCRLQVLTGMGNGDLVMDSRTNQMMPPPPRVEAMLADAFGFMQHYIQVLLSMEKVDDKMSVNTDSRSDRAKKLSSTFASLVSQLQSIFKGFPSSMALSSGIAGIMEENLQRIYASNEGAKDDNVKPLCLLYASLLGGEDMLGNRSLEACTALLKLDFFCSNEISRSDKQALWSVFEYARWGSLLCLLRSMLSIGKEVDDETSKFLQELFDKAHEIVEATPLDALDPLFQCVLVAGQLKFLVETDSITPNDGAECLGKISDTIFGLMEECKTAKERLYMANGMCRLLFHHSLLRDEAERLQGDPCALDPIRSAFRRLMKMAGTKRPFISSAVLANVTIGWLGHYKDSPATAGKSAIPYLDDLVRMLLHKEDSINEESRVVQASPQKEIDNRPLPLPTAIIHNRSLARGILLVFLSELPGPSVLEEETLKQLVHPLIFGLFDAVRSMGTNGIMLGSVEYCRKMRGWQALCVLSRFVTKDIAEVVCTRTFEAMEEQIHGQIRYFIEVFTIQCSRRFPDVFAEALVTQITRYDLSLQMIASLMIVAGNLIVGRYQNEFLPFIDGSHSHTDSKLDLVLSGVIPWLSSTQGFSRAIAQLLVHKLIPVVVDLSSAKDKTTEHGYARSIYTYLESNSEMKRLRRKQSKFFESYDADKRCTAEGVLSVPVDEGGESHPIHAVEAMKECLKEVYAEAHVNDTPTWKQVELMLKAQESDSRAPSVSDEMAINFQRKIIPLDALNLALEEVTEKRKRNAARRKKQDLIVCASLIDKVPNLGGLARTSEIFAVDRLIIPDRNIAKMDNFNSISVGAGDWIDIEECKEKDLLRWLRQRKEEGYFVVGLEQTSSSVSLTDFSFPRDRPIVLLLGKEKEGIPIEFLQSVDQCVEIPQMGIIRSLNVHVSGAITIWEHTKQKLISNQTVS